MTNFQHSDPTQEELETVRRRFFRGYRSFDGCTKLEKALIRQIIERQLSLGRGKEIGLSRAGASSPASCRRASGVSGGSTL